MQIFGIGLPEMAVIAAIGLLVFGPKRLPELGRTLGSTLRGFQKASEEFQQEFQQAIHPDERAATPATLSAEAAGEAGLPAATRGSTVATGEAGDPPAAAGVTADSPAPGVQRSA